MISRIKFVSCVIAVALMALAGTAQGAILFFEDFEGDALGAAPMNFEMLDHPHSKPGVFLPVVVEDPLGQSGKVEKLNTSSVYVPKAEGRDNWADWVWEWDWMWAVAAAPSTAFRVTGVNYYHFSPRADNMNIGFWLYDGAFNQIGDLVGYDFGLSTWNRFQVSCIGNEITLKIKRSNDPTPFSEIDPLIQANDDTLTSGPMSCSGIFNTESWVDNFAVAESAGDLITAVKSSGKLAVTWGSIK